jgi:hypothetical protein
VTVAAGDTVVYHGLFLVRAGRRPSSIDPAVPLAEPATGAFRTAIERDEAGAGCAGIGNR